MTRDRMIGPREMQAMRAGRSDSAIRWARITDRWDLVHHNLFRATKDSTIAMENLSEQLACPNDPDGVHHVGCGCDWADPE